jgi:hypothetical protein
VFGHGSLQPGLTTTDWEGIDTYNEASGHEVPVDIEGEPEDAGKV